MYNDLPVFMKKKMEILASIHAIIYKSMKYSNFFKVQIGGGEGQAPLNIEDQLITKMLVFPDSYSNSSFSSSLCA